MVSSIPKPMMVDVVYWYQYPRNKWNYRIPESTFGCGIQDSGKSNQLLAHATNYIAEGGRAIDGFGAENDSETMVYLLKNSPYRDSTLIIIGDDVKVESPFPTKRISEFSIRDDLKDYLVAVTDRSLYATDDSHYSALYRLFQLCVNRRGWKEHEGGRVVALIIREAWKVIYAQIRAGISRNEQEAMYELKRLNNQRAHSGIAPLLDAQRYMDVAPSFRTLCNYRVIKGFGGQPIPDEFNFLYKPSVLGKDFWRMRHMKPYEFLVVTSWNGVGLGVVEKAKFGIEKGKDLMEQLGITITPLETHDEGEKESGKPNVPVRTEKPENTSHLQVIKLRDEGMSMRKIAKEVGISPSTVADHISRHESGTCLCLRGSSYDRSDSLLTSSTTA